MAQIVATPILRDALVLEETAVAVLPPLLAADPELARAAFDTAGAGTAVASAAGVTVRETLVAAANGVVVWHTDRDAVGGAATPTVVTRFSTTTTLTTVALPTATGSAIRVTAVLVRLTPRTEPAAVFVLLLTVILVFLGTDILGEQAAQCGSRTTKHEPQSTSSGRFVAQPVDNYR